jgi:ribosome recycling factor
MDIILTDAKEKMEKTIESFKEELATLRTGRANAALLENIECDYYGDKIKINQISAIKVPEPRQLLIIPYDFNDLKSIYNALAKSDIGINPIIDGKQIRLVIPALTEDRRKDLVKKAKSFGEEKKIAIRNVRREALDYVKDDDSFTEDTSKREQEDVQKLTDEYIAKIDQLFKDKEKEIMTI